MGLIHQKARKKPPRWKVLSLLLQSSWPIFLVGWIIAVLAAIPLHFMEDLPKVLSYTCTSCFSQGRMPRYAKGWGQFLQIGKIPSKSSGCCDILWRLSPLLVCEWDRCPLLWWTCQYDKAPFRTAKVLHVLLCSIHLLTPSSFVLWTSELRFDHFS